MKVNSYVYFKLSYYPHLFLVDQNFFMHNGRELYHLEIKPFIGKEARTISYLPSLMLRGVQLGQVDTVSVGQVDAL